MSKAHENDVKRHFKGKVRPRLDIKMLPRDVHRVTGTLRSVLVTSFNYCRRYPVKLEKFIEVLRFVANFALCYQAEEKAMKDKAADIKLKEKAKAKDKEEARLAAEERLAKQEREEGLNE